LGRIIFFAFLLLRVFPVFLLPVPELAAHASLSLGASCLSSSGYFASLCLPRPPTPFSIANPRRVFLVFPPPYIKNSLPSLTSPPPLFSPHQIATTYNNRTPLFGPLLTCFLPQIEVPCCRFGQVLMVFFLWVFRVPPSQYGSRFPFVSRVSSRTNVGNSTVPPETHFVLLFSWLQDPGT